VGTEEATERSTGAQTMGAMLLAAASEHEGTALRFKQDDEWQEVSYAELGDHVRAIAQGLIELGIEPGDRVAIFSDTRAEWTLADFAVLCAGAVSVPVYQTSSAEECRHVLSDSEARLVFCESEELLDRVEEVRGDCPALEHVVLLAAQRDGVQNLNDLRERGESVDERQVDERVEAVSGDDLFTLIYTSGTTGPAKGCRLTHSNYRANLSMMEQTAGFGGDATVFVFLPLAHALTRMTQMLAVDVGATLVYWEQDKDKLIDNLKEVQPTHFPAVPRIFEKIYHQATAQADGAVTGKLLDKAVEAGREKRDLERQGDKPGPILRKEFDLADKRMLSKVRDLFGGRLELALTGAAPVAQEMLEFFYAAGILVLEGYGATETSAVATVNRPDDFRFGTVGKALPDTEVTTAEDGEIRIRGPHIFQGYHNNDEETAEKLDDDGWFSTGDLGELDDDGFLRIVGRKKDIIVTSSGKNVTASNIEQAISSSRWISQAVVVGDDRPYLVALVTIDEDERAKLADEAGTSEDPEQMAGSEEVREKIQEAVDAANADLAKVEQVKKFAILDRDLDQEHDELTPTMKVKRNVVIDNHADVIDGLYEDD
jgi:long-chain acyl-CoA synthetase